MFGLRVQWWSFTSVNRVHGSICSTLEAFELGFVKETDYANYDIDYYYSYADLVVRLCGTYAYIHKGKPLTG